MSRLRVAFVVQGEGRGHMTQALALASMLRDAGHELTRVMVGRSRHRTVPSYFTESIGARVIEFEAPVQVPDDDRRGVSVRRTLGDAVRRSPRFFQSAVAIAENIKDVDVVVNLLDLMAGVSRGLFPSQTPALAVAHNYLFLHPELAGAPGPARHRSAILAYARATATRTDRKVALSFTPLSSRPELSLDVAPPLLRPGLDRLEPHDGGYLVAYALNSGYGTSLIDWQRASGVEVHCFVDGGAAVLPESAPGFHAHDLDATSFLGHLAGCRAYVGSAGFESLCEAHFLGKPTLAVPTKGQFEQTLNAWDAERCGVARAGSYDDVDDFWREPGAPDPAQVETFRAWVARAADVLVDAVERTARSSSRSNRQGPASLSTEPSE